jgi:hypothetical protein
MNESGKQKAPENKNHNRSKNFGLQSLPIVGNIPDP